NIVQHQQGAALGKPLFSGSGLLFGRPCLKPKLELRRQLGRYLGDWALAAKLKHDRVERALCLPGKLKGKRGLSAARLAVEQRSILLFHKHGVKLFERFSATYEILRLGRQKDACRAALAVTAHVAKTLNPLNSLAPRFFRVAPGIDPMFHA